jgi:ribosomal protein S6
MIERVAEAIRKFQAVIDTEHDMKKKAFMNSVLASMKAEYEAIVRENIPCPPDMIEEVDRALKLIDDMYNKKACN